jgi:hypothetical protein
MARRAAGLLATALLMWVTGCEPAPTELTSSPAAAPPAVAIDRSTPQAVVEAFLTHFVAEDWLAMLECVEPDQRAGYEVFLAFHKVTMDRIGRNAALAGDMLGDEDGELVLLAGRYRFWGYGALFPLPVAPLTLSPQWELIDVTLVGQVAEMRVDDVLAAVLVLEGGRWYLSGVEYRGELRDKAQWVQTPRASALRWFIDAELDRMYNRLLDGQVTRQELLDNSDLEFVPAWEQRDTAPQEQITDTTETKDTE